MKLSTSNSDQINLLGVYSVPEKQEVYLLEFMIKTPPENIVVDEFTQVLVGLDRSNWQVPWDEKYLDESGQEIIGDWLEIPKGHQGNSRFTFFFHHLNFDLSFTTPFGEVDLIEVSELPKRLSSLIHYEEP